MKQQITGTKLLYHLSGNIKRFRALTDIAVLTKTIPTFPDSGRVVLV